jgi:2,3-bisphosphoglycerate-independent phosphoglycerate mutase
MECKLLMVILDGLGDRPIRELGWKTPLQASRKEHIDAFAEHGINGLMDPIAPGVPAGSDTSHLALLGYDPYEVYTGRGPFEAVGVGIQAKPGDIALRCNFSTVDKGLIVRDRRAGRIRQGTVELAKALDGLEIDSIRVLFRAGTEHRAALVLRGPGLSPKVSDPDPHDVGHKVARAEPLAPEARTTATALNRFVEESHRILEEHPVNRERVKAGLPPANIVLPRGAGEFPHLEPLERAWGLRAACIAGVTLVKGICRAVGMEILEVKGATGGLDTDMMAKAHAAVGALDHQDLVFINIKAPDVAGHDGKPQDKIAAVEGADQVFKYLSGELPEAVVLALTADHSTPCALGNHSGDPVPLLIHGPSARVDRVRFFDELSAADGGLGRLRGKELLPVLLDLAYRSKKFGA